MKKAVRPASKQVHPKQVKAKKATAKSAKQVRPPKLKKQSAKSISNKVKQTKPKQHKTKVKSVSAKAKSAEFTKARQTGVRKAWADEAKLVQATGKGTRDWSKTEIKQLAQGGKVKGYHGHHINSVSKNSKKMAENSNNIKFVTPKEHLKEHKGDWKNPTKGKLVDRHKLIRDHQRKAPKKPK